MSTSGVFSNKQDKSPSPISIKRLYQYNWNKLSMRDTTSYSRNTFKPINMIAKNWLLLIFYKISWKAWATYGKNIWNTIDKHLIGTQMIINHTSETVREIIWLKWSKSYWEGLLMLVKKIPQRCLSRNLSTKALKSEIKPYNYSLLKLFKQSTSLSRSSKQTLQPSSRTQLKMTLNNLLK